MSAAHLAREAIASAERAIPRTDVAIHLRTSEFRNFLKAHCDEIALSCAKRLPESFSSEMRRICLKWADEVEDARKQFEETEDEEVLKDDLIMESIFKGYLLGTSRALDGERCFEEAQLAITAFSVFATVNGIAEARDIIANGAKDENVRSMRRALEEDGEPDEVIESLCYLALTVEALAALFNPDFLRGTRRQQQGL